MRSLQRRAGVAARNLAVPQVPVQARMLRGRAAVGLRRAAIESAGMGAVLRRSNYFTSCSILNIGRYIAITIVPTMTPTPIIMIGSMIEVSEAMLVSTSSS